MKLHKFLQAMRLGMVTFAMLGAAAAASACTAAPPAGEDAPGITTSKDGKVPEAKTGTAASRMTWDESWGESGVCSAFDRDFEASATYVGNYDPREAVEAAACDIAEADAVEACERSSGKLCAAKAGKPYHRHAGCTERSNNNWTCSCDATVDCTYSLF